MNDPRVERVRKWRDNVRRHLDANGSRLNPMQLARSEERLIAFNQVLALFSPSPTVDVTVPRDDGTVDTYQVRRATAGPTEVQGETSSEPLS